MAGRTDPPEGTPGGAPGAGDEEYQSTVFDESFVKAARLQELSAQERLEDHSEAVRSRLPESGGPAARVIPKQGIALALIILLAFAAAIYLGSNNPYGSGNSAAVEPPAGAVIPLAPQGEVPGSRDAEALYAGSPADEFGMGAGGVALPDPRATVHFTSEQVLTALTVAKEYVVASSLTPEVLAGNTYIPVRELLGPEQREQFDRAMAGHDPYSVPTDWLVRFDADPAGQQVALADPLPRVDGEFDFREIDEDVLQVSGHHVFVYAVRPAGEPRAPAALFVVEREILLQFGEGELRERQAVVRQADVLAGPMDCEAESDAALVPLLAGERATHPPAERATDPFTRDAPGGAPVCGTLSPAALPELPTDH
ncbi:SCO2583 family membrane protein [Streptomyces sp. 6N223]|uniref:SCO2583 family membrane protein n=1 Tax=Streptomyces sp. 6N223 TaxID=3457412 RepID=UPI003FCF9468